MRLGESEKMNEARRKEAMSASRVGIRGMG